MQSMCISPLHVSGRIKEVKVVGVFNIKQKLIVVAFWLRKSNRKDVLPELIGKGNKRQFSSRECTFRNLIFFSELSRFLATTLQILHYINCTVSWVKVVGKILHVVSKVTAVTAE